MMMPSFLLARTHPKGDEGFTFAELIVGMLVLGLLFGGLITLILRGGDLIEKGTKAYSATAGLTGLLRDLKEELEDLNYDWWEAPPEWRTREDGFSLHWISGKESRTLELSREGDRIWIDSTGRGRRDYFVSKIPILFTAQYLPDAGIEGIILEIKERRIVLAVGSRPLLFQGLGIQ